MIRYSDRDLSPDQTEMEAAGVSLYLWEGELALEERVAAAVAKLARIDGIGDEWAMKLVYAGFLSIEGLMAADLSDLEAIEDITHEKAQELWKAAEKAYTAQHGEIAE